jgi:hypothetical protein
MLNFDFKTHYELLKKFECDGWRRIKNFIIHKSSLNTAVETAWTWHGPDFIWQLLLVTSCCCPAILVGGQLHGLW